MQTNHALKIEIYSFLKRFSILSFATYSYKLYIATLFYAVNSELSLFFLSHPKSHHCLSFNKNQKIACTIYNSMQFVTEKRIGIQYYGSVSEITDKTELIHALSLWHSANPGCESTITVKSILKHDSSYAMYHISPKQIKFTDETQPGPLSVRELHWNDAKESISKKSNV